MKTKITFDCVKDLDLARVRKRALAEFNLCRNNIITGINPKTGRDHSKPTDPVCRNQNGYHEPSSENENPGTLRSICRRSGEKS